MKKKLLFALLLIALATIGFIPGDNYYNSLTGNIICNEYCWHEIGHKLDHQNDWISKTDEFRTAVDHLVNKDFFSIYYLGDQEFGMYAEYYAEILQAVNGNVDLLSRDLQQFYNIEQINILSAEINN